MISNLFHLMAWQGIEEPYHHPQRGMDGGMAICVAIMGKIGLCHELHIHSWKEENYSKRAANFVKLTEQLLMRRRVVGGKGIYTFYSLFLALGASRSTSLSIEAFVQQQAQISPMKWKELYRSKWMKQKTLLRLPYDNEFRRMTETDTTKFYAKERGIQNKKTT